MVENSNYLIFKLFRYYAYFYYIYLIVQLLILYNQELEKRLLIKTFIKGKMPKIP